MKRIQVALGLLRPGDWLLMAGLAGLVALPWGHGTKSDQVVIKTGGKVFMAVSPRLNREINVPGPLGTTVVEILGGRVRVKSDPGPRQICVKQGWIGPGQVAICLPNRVSVERGATVYDSLNY